MKLLIKGILILLISFNLSCFCKKPNIEIKYIGESRVVGKLNNGVVIWGINEKLPQERGLYYIVTQEYIRKFYELSFEIQKLKLKLEAHENLDK